MAQSQPRLHYVPCISQAGFHRMAYWEWGDSANPRVLLCVHGLTRNGRDFDKVARTFADYYRVVCPDIVGRGASDTLINPDFYTVPQYMADCVALLARINADHIDYIGTSMGGLIGLGLAGWSALKVNSFANAPTVFELPPYRFLFNKMVLNDVAPTIDEAALKRIAKYVGQPQSYATFEEAVNRTKIRCAPFGPLNEEQWQEFTRVGLIEANGQWQQKYDLSIAQAFEHEYSDETKNRIEELMWNAYSHIPCPILVLHGEESDLLSKKTVKKMQSMNDNTHVVSFAKQGHAPTLLPDNQITVLKDFLFDE
ncbi:alpha/beta fold hydrolase [Brackiella oedipodis]|uniref:alpha/beta fold hydrolase n=1 Tax=Brackiella oedipodis TaxID=124225 RepID=UPI00048C9CA1|nr:alpha/beta hydrolase [Brackiella oedipodis]